MAASAGSTNSKRVGDHEAERAEQVQALVDAAVVVVAVVVPALDGDDS